MRRAPRIDIILSFPFSPSLLSFSVFHLSAAPSKSENRINLRFKKRLCRRDDDVDVGVGVDAGRDAGSCVIPESHTRESRRAIPFTNKLQNNCTIFHNIFFFSAWAAQSAVGSDSSSGACPINNELNCTKDRCACACVCACVVLFLAKIRR